MQNHPSFRMIADVIWDILQHQRPSAKSDIDILQALERARPEGLPFNGPARRNWSIVEAVQLMSMTSDGQCSTLGLARWAQHGFRTVVMPATYAAALCATVPPPSLENLLSPVPAFMIEVPGELLPVENPAGADF